MSEYECVIIIILSSGSVWPVVHNLMVRTLEANKKVDECTCQQRHKALFCVSNTYCRLWWPLYWIQKSQKVLKTVKSYQLLFFYSKEWKTVYTTWPVMLHSATRMYSWRLHTVASKTTSSQTKTRHTHTQTSAILLWVSAQVFNRLSTEKNIPRGVGCPLTF